MSDDPVALGVDLLAHLECETISLADAMDRIELVTTDPDRQREILDRAVDAGVIEREGDVLTVESGRFVRFGSDVITKEGEFSCRRCGTSLSTGYFIRLASGEVGPFGSSCIRKVTGRD